MRTFPSLRLRQMSGGHVASVLFLGIAGLGLYLWPALEAPVVLWSDSALDLAWARDGAGLTKAVPAPAAGTVLGHSPKPAYLVFVRWASRVVPGAGPERSIVIVQSVLLWISIAGTSLAVWRRRSAAAATATYLFLLTFLRLRDSASAVMPEAVSAALFLPIAAVIFELPSRKRGIVATAAASALLFFVRPNVAAIAAVLFVFSLLVERRRRALLIFAGASILFVVPIWLATCESAGPDPFRRLGYPVLEATAEYLWHPALEEWPRTPKAEEIGRAEFARAGGNWRATLAKRRYDVRREIAWRALHGILGTEFYDARWSSKYALVDTVSRTAAPVVFLAAAALAVTAFMAGDGRRGALVLLFLILAIGQGLVLGAIPRFFLPLTPFLLLFVARPAPGGPVRRAVSLGAFLLLLVLVRAGRHTLDREWGRVEQTAVTIRQVVPRGEIPRQAPSTLHIRIGAPLTPSTANFQLMGPGNRILYSSDGDSRRNRLVVTVPVPAWLAADNASRPSELVLVSFGEYGSDHYLMFPVIPLPWAPAATREGSDSLSPSTGISSGSLDLWFHRGTP